MFDKDEMVQMLCDESPGHVAYLTRVVVGLDLGFEAGFMGQ